MIVLVFVIVFCFALLGYKISDYYKSRKNFYNALESFLSSLNLDIYFSQSKLIDILKNYILNTTNVDLKKLCLNIVDKLSNFKPLDYTIFDDIKILRKDEKETMLKFFISLGKYDVFAQTKEIKFFKTKVHEMVELVNNDCKKYSTLFIKLGIVLGLLVCLMII